MPVDLVWRKKAQFDEGSGTIELLELALQQITGATEPFDREAEGALYERLLREQYVDPELILESAGSWG